MKQMASGVRTGRKRARLTSIVGAFMLVSAFFFVLPTGVAHGLTGTVQLAAVDSVPNPTSATVSTTNESVIAGTSQVVSIDGVMASPAKVFAIDFAGVTFSGSQFKLYMSTNGFAEIETTDVGYGPLFTVSDFANSTDAWKPYQGSLGLGLTGTFYIGSTKSGTPMVAGPIAMNISDAYEFIKIFDGSSVGVSDQAANPQPGMASLHATPTSGAPGTPVTVVGGGFPAGMQVNINATYFTNPWVGSTKTNDVSWLKGQSTGSGSFTTLATPMLDAKQVIDPKLTGPFPTVSIQLFAVNSSHVSQVMNSDQKSLGLTPGFTEFSRGIASVTSYSSSGVPVDTTHGAFRLGYLFGNDSGSTGTVGAVTIQNLPTINAKVFGKLYVAGNFSYVGKPVTFWLGSSPATAVEMNTTAPVIPDSKGFWNATVIVPILSAGTYQVWIENDGVNYASSSGVTGTVTTTTTTSTTTSATSTTSTTSTTSSTTSTSITTSTTSTTSSTSSSSTSTQSSSTSTSTSTSSAASSSSTTTSSTSTSPGGGGSPDYTYYALGGAVAVLAVVGSYLALRWRRVS